MMRQGASERERERDIRKEKECVVCECVCLGMKGACEQLEILYFKVLSSYVESRIIVCFLTWQLWFLMISSKT